MGLYIKDMEMPFTCLSCVFRNCAAGIGDYCTLTKKKLLSFKNRPSYCPLAPVPPHGDLIDRDALPTSRVEWEDIVNAPTIIEAEKPKEG